MWPSLWQKSWATPFAACCTVSFYAERVALGADRCPKGKALLEGYQSVRPLLDAEIEALPLLCRGSALRFFLTRLYDWIMTPPDAMVTKKDPLEYLRKMRFHKSVGAVREYGLAMPSGKN